MSDIRGNESTFEEATIQRLRLLGYEYVYGPELDRDPSQVVLLDVLRANLRERYPQLSETDLSAAIERITRPAGATTLYRNEAFHTGVLTRGFELVVDRPMSVADARAVGRPMLTGPVDREVVHIHPIDWEHPDRNRFHVVNQLRIAGPDRIPDIVVYVNGIPLVRVRAEESLGRRRERRRRLEPGAALLRALPSALRVQRPLRALGRQQLAPRDVDCRHGVVRPLEVRRTASRPSPARPARCPP